MDNEQVSSIINTEINTENLGSDAGKKLTQTAQEIPQKKESVVKGILWILLSSFGFAFMGMMVRLSGDLPFMQKALFRNSIALFIALTSLVMEGRKNKSVYIIQKGAWIYLLLRSFLGSFGIFGNFYAVDRMNISDAAMLNKMSPFFSLLGSFIIMKEKPSLVGVLTLITAFCGALFVIKPSFDLTKLIPSIAGFLGGAGAGFAYACVRKLHKDFDINGKVIITFFSLFSCLISIPFFIIQFTPMTFVQVLCLLGAGAGAAVGQFGITNAYFNAPSSKISIFEYSNIIFSALMGFFAFAQIPDWLSFAGYFIIISSAAVNFFYNYKKAHKN